MELKDKINEIENYFIQKVLNKEFEITMKSRHTWKILVDGLYEFSIWVGNWDIKASVDFYHGSSEGYFMKLYLTRQQRIKLRSIIREDYKNWNSNPLVDKKLKQIEKLKAEIAEIRK